MPTIEFPQDLEEEQYEGLIQEQHPWGSGRRLGTGQAQIEDGEEGASSSSIRRGAEGSKEEQPPKGDLDEVKVILSIVEQMRKRPTLSKAELIVELRKMLAAFGGQGVTDSEGNGNGTATEKEKEKDNKGKGKAPTNVKGRKQINAKDTEGDLLRQVVMRNLLTWGRDEIISRERVNDKPFHLNVYRYVLR